MQVDISAVPQLLKLHLRSLYTGIRRDGGRGCHESHLTRPFPFTVIPADLAVGAGSRCQNINKRDYMYNDSPLSGFSV